MMVLSRYNSVYVEIKPIVSQEAFVEGRKREKEQEREREESIQCLGI
jgi:hypothetical protein